MALQRLLRLPNRTPARHNAAVRGRGLRKAAAGGRRSRTGDRKPQAGFHPHEDWHEPTGGAAALRFVVQAPGPELRHVLTPEEIRGRLAELPPEMVAPLEVVQLSRLTRKRSRFPCYGMQWGSAVYLYPIEENLVEYFARPPKPAQVNEARMYGGRWSEAGPGLWRLEWTEPAIKDFYLNNILIHELGHLLDHRNRSYADRERFAEWFAIEYGYRASRRKELAERAAAKLLTVG